MREGYILVESNGDSGLGERRGASVVGFDEVVLGSGDFELAGEKTTLKKTKRFDRLWNII